MNRQSSAPEAQSTSSASDASARVAVVIPCFNDGGLITETLGSLAESQRLETVVVDDASTDAETVRILTELQATGLTVLRHEENRGLPAARMTGLRATAAPYVFPLDSDDLAVPGALARMADLLDERPEAGVCFGDYLEFGTRERIVRVPARLDPYRIVYRNEYPVSSMFRRSTLEAAGGWKQVGSYVGYEDWNLWMTLAERGAVGIHWGQGVALRRRLHGSRMLAEAGRQHLALYATLRREHPDLFSARHRNRRSSDLSPANRWLYPILYGWRPPLGLRTKASRVSERRSPTR